MKLDREIWSCCFRIDRPPKFISLMLSRWTNRKHSLFSRLFCSARKLDWTSGNRAIAEELFRVYTVDIDDGPRCDPRGMRPFELKKKLSEIKEFSGDLTQTHQYHPDIITIWQSLYNEFMNGNVKLPGRDPAGPLTFHHDADKENVRMLYDKHGRVEH